MPKTNFSAWLDAADMPQKGNDGKWFDLETGLAYDPTFNYVTRAARTTLSAKSLDARAVAKAFGGKALKGTAKQKEWAEKIRAEKLADMTHDQAEMACDPEGILTNSKFWIESRGKSGAEIGAFVIDQKALLAQARALHAANNADEYRAVAAQYNALTAKWGF